MRVLYVNHTATVSGGERSLLTLLRALPREVEATVACPPGELADRVAATSATVAARRGPTAACDCTRCARLVRSSKSSQRSTTCAPAARFPPRRSESTTQAKTSRTPSAGGRSRKR